MTDQEKNTLYDAVDNAIQKLISELPDDIRKKADEIPCLLDSFSPPDNHPEALGRYMAFTNGPIIIYVEAIHKAENGNIDGVCQSVRHVYLHELGHVLGLNEIELKNRSL